MAFVFVFIFYFATRCERMNEGTIQKIKVANANPFQMCTHTVHVYAHTSAVIMIPDNSSCSDELNKMKYNE